MDIFERAELVGWIVGVAVALLVLVDGWWFVTDAPWWRSRARRVVGMVGRAVLVVLFAPIAGVVIGLAAWWVALFFGGL